MNSTTVVLRRKPFFLIKVEEYTFEIKNEEDKNNDGKYEFDQIASFELQNKHVNWIVTALSYIIDFIGGPSGQIYKEKNLFKFYYKNEYKRILLTNCDITKARKVTRLINYRLRKINQNSIKT